MACATAVTERTLIDSPRSQALRSVGTRASSDTSVRSTYAYPRHLSTLPRILFFGGDMVSVTALEAVHERMRCILETFLASTLPHNGEDVDGSGAMCVNAYLRHHLVVVCPSLPHNMAPEVAAQKYSRQYPVVRYAVENELDVFPVDDPKSFAKSRLFKEMLVESAQGVEGVYPRRSPTVCSRQLGPCTEGGREGAVGQGWGRPHTWSAAGHALRDFDLAVVVSFRYFLPKRMLEALPPTINLHPSLLPKYRGASPIFTTLMRQDPVGGTSLIQLRPEQTMDSGNVLWQAEVPLPPDMDVRSYFPLVTQVGSAGLCDIIFGKQGAAPEEADTRQRYTWLPHTGEATADSVHTSTPWLSREVIREATRTHSLHLQSYSEGNQAMPLGSATAFDAKTPKSRPTKCSDLFVDSVLTSYCDWPHTFWYNWRTAPAQRYEVYSHFSADPNHAPRLPKDAAVLRFSTQSGRQAHGTWRAFVGGLYFHPSVNATIDKGSCPVRNQLLRRALLRRVRQTRTSGRRSPPPASQLAKEKVAKTPEEYPIARSQPDLSDAVVTPAMLAEVEGSLRISCSFTEALAPDLVPSCVAAELQAVEDGVGARFYRPLPLFHHQQRGQEAVSQDSTAALSPARNPGREKVTRPRVSTARARVEVANCAETAVEVRASLEAAECSAAAEEEAPTDYVPDIIHAAPPSAIWVPEDTPTNVSVVDTSTACRDCHGASVPSPTVATPGWYISPGTAYFLVSRKNLCAVKCCEGWFLWSEAHLQFSPRPQSASLLRQGLAMKRGVLYAGLFSEYCV